MALATYKEAFREYARNAGAEDTGAAWILTPWDTWEANPHYKGPPARHPEEDPEDDFIGPLAPFAIDEEIPF